jgi:hypothetical protein
VPDFTIVEGDGLHREVAKDTAANRLLSRCSETSSVEITYLRSTRLSLNADIRLCRK